MRSHSPSLVQKRDTFLKLRDGSLQVLHCWSLTVLGDMEGSQESETGEVLPFQGESGAK